MATRRIFSSILLRSSSRRSACKCPISNTNPNHSTPPSLSSTRGSTASAYGYLLNRTSEYATSAKPPPSSESPTSDGNNVGDSAIVDEFPGKGSTTTGQVCRLKGNIVDVRFEEEGYLPQIGTVLKVLDNNSRYGRPCQDAGLEVVDILDESTVRTCSVDGTGGLVIGQRVLNTDFPNSHPPPPMDSVAAIKYINEAVFREPSREQELESSSDSSDERVNDSEEVYARFQDLEDTEREVEGMEQDLGPDLDRVCESLRKYLLKKQLLEKRRRDGGCMTRVLRSSTVRYGSIGTVCRLEGDAVHVRFHKKFEIGTVLEVLPTNLEAFPKLPLVLHVCQPIQDDDDDDDMVRATAVYGTEGLVVGESVFGFPVPFKARMSNELEEGVDSLKREVARLEAKLRLLKQREKHGRK